MLKYYGSTTVVLPPKRKEEEKNRREIEKEENRKRKEEEIEIMKSTYNSLCTNLPKIQKITQDREKAIDKFLKEFTIEQFKQICQIANSTDFLIGNNDRKWTADFDFLMRIDKATNVLEGKYSSNKGGMNDFVELWKEAQNDEARNDTDNSSIGGKL